MSAASSLGRRRALLVGSIVVLAAACGSGGSASPPRFFATETGDGGALVEIDARTGNATRVSGRGLRAPQLGGFAFEAASGTFYAVREGTELVRVDAGARTVTSIGAIGLTGVGAAVLDEPAGVLYAVNASGLVRIDPASGLGTLVAPLDFELSSLALDAATDTLYGITQMVTVFGVQPWLLSFDRDGNGFRVVGGLDFLTRFFGESVALAFDPVGRRLLAAHAYFNGSSVVSDLLEIDVLSGTSTELVDLAFARVTQLSIDPGTGALFGVDAASEQVLEIDVATGAGASLLALGLGEPTDLALDAATGTLYAVDGRSRWLFTLDPATLVAAAVGPLGDVHALAYDAGRGVLHAVDATTDELLRIDPHTGTSEPIGALGSPAVHALAYDPALDALYGADVETGELLVIDPVGATSVVVGPLGFDDVESLVFDPIARALFGVEVGEDRLLRIDLATGAGTVVGSVGFDDVRGLAFDPASRTCYGMDARLTQLATIRLQSGAATAVGALGFDRVSDLAFDPAGHALYGLQEESLLIRIDPADGTGTTVRVLEEPLHALTFDPGSRTLYGLACDPANDCASVLVTLDPASGVADRIGAVGFQLHSLAADPWTGALYGLAGYAGLLIRIDPRTGAGLSVGEATMPCGKLAFAGGVLYGADFAEGGLLVIDPSSVSYHRSGQSGAFVAGLAGPIR